MTHRYQSTAKRVPKHMSHAKGDAQVKHNIVPGVHKSRAPGRHGD
jgi:hypothetical protein